MYVSSVYSASLRDQLKLVEDPSQRDSLLKKLAKELFRLKNLSESIAYASQIIDPGKRDRIFAWMQSPQAAFKIENQQLQKNTYEQILLKMVQEEQYKEALDLAKQQDCSDWCGLQLVIALSQKGDLYRAVNHIPTITDPNLQDQARVSCVRAYLKNDDLASAKSLLQKIQNTQLREELSSSLPIQSLI
jgi:hypothetical protein